MYAFWTRLSGTQWVLAVLSFAYAFALLFDPGALRLRALRMPLWIYGVVLVFAVILPFFSRLGRFIGYILGGVAFFTFTLGLVWHWQFDSRAHIETSVASTTIYGCFAALYWIEAYKNRAALVDWKVGR